MKFDKCIECNKCAKNCLFLQKYGNPKIIEEKILNKEYPLEISYECSLCGLCESLCPENLKIKEYFLELRGKIPPLKQHKNILNFEKWMASSFFKTYIFPENSDTLIFLGCAITGKPPKFIKKLIANVEENLNKKCAIAIDCCFKISHDLGNISLFKEKIKEKIKILKEKKIKRIITICPSCFDVFKNYTDFEVKLIYDFLDFEKINLKEKKFSVHDPCSIRNENKIHLKVRELLQKIGIDLEKMPHEMDKTFCCGEGGAAGFIDRSYAKFWKKRRLNEAKNPIIVYCYGCRAFLKNRKIKVYHILDILFNDFSEISTLKIWINRFRLKLNLRKMK